MRMTKSKQLQKKKKHELISTENATLFKEIW